MIVNNIDALRSWLITKLTPMCDADPHALAKYVIALIKKDKSMEDLRQECSNQLEVFLQKETGGFVSILFDALKNENYVSPNENEDSQNKEENREKPKDLRKRLQRSPVRHRSRSPPYGGRRPPPRRYDYDNRRRSPPVYRRRNRSISPRRSSPSWRRSPRRGDSRRSPRRRRSWSRSRSSRSKSRSDSSQSRSPERKDDAAAKKKIRCWDYDQKGFCVRGDACDYDHGTNPVVLDESVLPVVSKNSTTPAINPAIPPPAIPPPPGVHGPPPPMPPPFMLNHPPPPLLPAVMHNVPPPRMPMMPRAPPPGYNPEAPAINYQPRPQNLTNLVPLSIGGTLLRPGVPINSFNRKRVGQMGGDAEPAVKKPFYQPNRYTSTNTGAMNRNFNHTNTKLVICKIPPPLNNITKLNEHFSKFGAINNIQVKFENDPNTALIEFAHVVSARNAKNDPGAVLNNRFIQIFWHNATQQAQTQANRLPIKERLGPVALPSQLKYTAPGKETTRSTNKQVTLNSGSLSRTVVNNTTKNDEPEANNDTIVNKKLEEHDAQKKILIAKQATKQKQLNHQKLVIQQKVDLQKRRQDLMKSQIQQQKLLLNKVDSNKNMSLAEKTKIIKTLKVLSSSIDNLRKALHNDVGAVNPDLAKQKKAMTQKELLDAELDLYNASTAGENTVTLKMKLNQLQNEAHSLGLVNAYKSWTRGRGRGGHRGHGRQSQRQFHSSATLDRRPRELRISGFMDDEKDEIVSHFSEFGNIETFSFQEDGIMCIVKYRTRSEAENASVQAIMFKNRKLLIVWHTPATRTVLKEESTTEESSDALVVPENNDGEEEVVKPEEEDSPLVEEDFEQDDDAVNYDDEIDEEALLAGDFDEEDDEEARTWRH